MACTVTITSVTGVPLANGSAGAISGITVSGTSTGIPDGANIGLFCACFNNANNAASATVMSNAWQATAPVVLLDPRESACSCGQDITIELFGPGCGSNWAGPIACPACPQIEIEVQVGNCAGGVADVTLTVNVTQPAGSTAVLQWQFGDSPGDNGVAFVVNGTGSGSQTHAYAQGTFTATLLTISPSGCPPQNVEITIPNCDCPQIEQITFSQGDCDGNGNRQVTATVTGGPAGTILWQWDFDSVPKNDGAMSTRVLAGGTTHSVTVSITAGSCQQFLSATVDVKTCENTNPQCPSITGLTATPSSGNVALMVTFVATVANQGSTSGANPYVWDFGDGNSANTANPTASNTYAAAGSYSACVTVNGPASCGTSKPVCTNVTVNSNNGGGGGGTTKGICGTLLVIAIALILIGSLITVIGVCTQIVWIEVIGIAAVALGVILFAIWAIFCSSFTACSVMVSMDCLLRWMISVVGPILIFLCGILGTGACGLASAVSWGGWGTVQNILEAIMVKKKCEIPACF